MPFGSQNRFQIRQNPSSEIINFLTLILHAFLVPSGSNNDVFASGCLCGLDIFHSFEPCSAFLPKKLPTSDPKGCSERSKIGNKNNRILEPEKITKMNSKWLPFGDLGPTMVGPGGAWEPSGVPKQDPCVIFTKIDSPFTEFNVYFMTFAMIFTPLWHPSI